MKKQSLYDRVLIAHNRIVNRRITIEKSVMATVDKERELEKIKFFEEIFSELLKLKFLDYWLKPDSHLNKMMDADPELSQVICFIQLRPGSNIGRLIIKLN